MSVKGNWFVDLMSGVRFYCQEASASEVVLSLDPTGPAVMRIPPNEFVACMRRPPDEVYSGPERDDMLAKMAGASNVFYGLAVRSGCHTFIEFCGLMNEFIKLCHEANSKGIDFTQASTHSGQALPASEHHGDYFGEKIDCIFGPTLRANESFRNAFLKQLQLPAGVGSEGEPAAS